MNIKFILILVFINFNLFAASISIATASKTGNYNKLGKKICSITNKKRKELGYICRSFVSAGSAQNVESVLNFKFDYALGQSDLINKKDLKVVFPFYDEIIVLALKNELVSKVKNSSYLNLNLSIGTKRSGTEATLNTLLENGTIKDIKRKLSSTRNLQKKLDRGLIDGFFYVTSHPSSVLKNMLNKNKLTLLGIEAKHKNQNMKILPKNTYNNQSEIFSISVQALLFTRIDRDEDEVYNITKLLYENLEKIRPLLKNYNFKKALKQTSDKLHNGSLKYFKELGLI